MNQKRYSDIFLSLILNVKVVVIIVWISSICSHHDDKKIHTQIQDKKCVSNQNKGMVSNMELQFSI